MSRGPSYCGQRISDGMAAAIIDLYDGVAMHSSRAHQNSLRALINRGLATNEDREEVLLTPAGIAIGKEIADRRAKRLESQP